MNSIGSKCLPFLICGLPLLGQQAPKVVEQSGHLSPVMVKVTFLNDASRNVMLRGFGIEANNSFGTHQYVVRADGGASTRRIWTDSIAVIKGTGSMRTRNSEFTIVLKNGTEVPVQFTGMNCAGELDQSTPAWDCRVMFTYNDDDGDQKIDLMKVKTVEFLGPARKDKLGCAMFDTWKYSPYTGEKLP
ncbi:MAG: hypothetical protein IT167_17920 [Bryobacterales bacterium]|nr:hypothetical protein [Bryobacterales bacterium]